MDVAFFSMLKTLYIWINNLFVNAVFGLQYPNAPINHKPNK